MQNNIQTTAFTAKTPAAIAALRNARGGDGTVTIVSSDMQSRQLYEIKSTLKPGTTKMLVKYAIDRLSGFGIADLANWDIEVSELDLDFIQVDFTSAAGATIGVEGIMLTRNKCGVVADHGVFANSR